MLLHIYLALNDGKSFGKFVKKYDDPSGAYMYAKALYGFMYKKDDIKLLSKLKKDAIESNKFIPALLRDGSDDEFLASTYQIGSIEEAKIYEDMYGDLWEKTEGAVEWLCKK